jgi:hypothetical protein
VYFCVIWRCKRKGKAIPVRAGQAVKVPEIWGSQISRQSAHESCQVVALHSDRLYPKEIYLVLISVRGWVDPREYDGPEWLCYWKTFMTPSGIEPATFHLIAQYSQW